MSTVVWKRESDFLITEIIALYFNKDRIFNPCKELFLIDSKSKNELLV